MTSPFQTLIPDARAFLAELSDNNNREWFNTHKTRYESALKKPAKLLLDDIATRLEAKLETPITTKLFRANRDIRFSKDKTPYTRHLHMMWSPQGSGTQPVYFFGIAEQYVKAGAGLMSFDKPQQTAWRAWVSEREGDMLQTQLDALQNDGVILSKPELKRVPSPFDQDHPRAELLRRKSLVLWSDIEQASTETDLPTALTKAFASFEPTLNELRSFL